MSYNILDWDSNFFGFGVARLTDAPKNEAAWQQELEQLKKQDVKLVYLSLEPEQTVEHELAKANGGLLTDEKITYSKKLGAEKIEMPEHVEIYSEKTVTPQLLNLSLESGIYSRYYIDPAVGKQNFERLYTAWIENSVSGQLADHVFVYVEDGDIAGMATVKAKNGTGSIGIIAVDKNYRGRSIGTKLVQAADSWYIHKNCNNASVVTQNTNQAAKALYEKQGYVIVKRENFFHFWL